MNVDMTKPTQEQLDGYKIHAGGIRARLEDAGLQPSLTCTTGTILVKYFVRTAGVESPKEMTVSQWESVLTGLDTLLKDPKKAVEAIYDVSGIRPPTEAEIEAAKKREETATKCQSEGCLAPASWVYPHGRLCKTHVAEAQAAWEKRREHEQSGPHAQRAKELAKSFLQGIEGEGYEGFAIIGVPNPVMRESSFDAHVEKCERCREQFERGNFDLCEDGHEAMCEDGQYDNIFAFKSSGAGEPDEFGLAETLESGNYDDVRCAETIEKGTDHPQITLHLNYGGRIQVDAGVADLILEMNFPGMTTTNSCEGSQPCADDCKGGHDYTPGYVQFSGPLSKLFAQTFLREMLTDSTRLLQDIAFTNDPTNKVWPSSLSMRWNPHDFPRVLQYAKAARQELDQAQANDAAA